MKGVRGVNLCFFLNYSFALKMPSLNILVHFGEKAFKLLCKLLQITSFNYSDPLLTPMIRNGCHDDKHIYFVVWQHNDLYQVPILI